jgi:Zn-dependent protease with chaperone function
MPSDAALPQEPAGAAAHAGRYSDGRTAAARNVGVRLAAGGLELTFEDTGERRLWPYDSLSTARPLHGRDADALVRSTSEPGAGLFVASPGFAAALLERTRQLTAGAERWRYLRPALAFVAVVAALSGLVWLSGWSPARAVARLVPAATWDAAGRQLVAGFAREGPCTEAAGQAALDKLVARITAATGADGQPFHVQVVRWEVVNAFAAPGRHLMLTRGLLRDARSPEEVAGVLAHEMGHGLELHPEAGVVRALGLTVAMKLILAGASETVQGLGGLLLQLRYTRIAERQADARAFELLRKAEISAKPMAAFFERIEKRDGAKSAGSRLPREVEILSSHPALAERAALARSQPDYPTRPIMSEADWQALRNICPPSSAKPAPAGEERPAR